MLQHYVLFGFRVTGPHQQPDAGVIQRLTAELENAALKHGGMLIELRPEDVFVLSLRFGQAPAAYRSIVAALDGADSRMAGRLQWFAQTIEGGGRLAHN